MLTITIDDREFRALFDRLSARMSDLTPVMEEIGGEMEKRVRERFEMERDPLGQPWAPWAESTQKGYPYPGSAAAKKAGRTGNARILDRFGDMLESVSWEADAASVSVGFGQPYAAYHEWGTKNMPRRGLLTADPDAGELAPDDETAVIDMITAWIDRP